MFVPPKYILTQEISRLLQRIEANNEVISSYPLPQEIEANIKRQSILKSSLFSARIEGNPLTLDELPQKSSTDQKKREVMNILRGFQFIETRGWAKDMTVSNIKQLHGKVMDGLIDVDNLGKFRAETSAIFNSAGIAIYLTPPPRQIETLLLRLLKFVNSEKEQFVPIRAALSHYIFEKIHPFLDGNGRVGRLILHAVLLKGGYGMRGLVSIEEYLDNNRNEYYRSLQDTEKDVTDYVEFVLAALAETSEHAKKLVLEKREARIEDYLLPRRAEILNIIKDHRIVNFGTIRRRFMAINPRTLRYDLKRLADEGLVRKRGTTNGVFYEAENLEAKD